MQQARYRHELKHYINYFDYLQLQSRLSHLMASDENACDKGSYKVRSLYFDNLYDKALREKLEGFSVREKFRLRYYNDDTSYMKLEKKSKLNGLCLKEAGLITRDECEMLLNGELSFLLAGNEKLFNELYAKMHTEQLRPKVIVDYQRQAYMYPAGNVRITIDSDIRASRSVREFLSPQLFCPRVSNNIILEVKYDDYLPQVIVNSIQLKNRHATAASKYAMGRTI
ncbi:MAG TPA: polyphosphate polymerase domain-containing protein [Syntrophomonadaceae bacterium]|nr:polyphosphate polymerase domain-containing protein [Syntrophomonadaceae bacterium]